MRLTLRWKAFTEKNVIGQKNPWNRIWKIMTGLMKIHLTGSFGTPSKDTIVRTRSCQKNSIYSLT